MSAWLAMWSYRIQERLTPARPKWLHLLLCSHCHGISNGAGSSDGRGAGPQREHHQRQGDLR